MMLVFRDGPVFTGEGRPPRRTSVAVREDRIIAVGVDALRLTGAADEVIELGDRLLMPGFHDAHVHPVQGGLNRMRCDLLGLPGRDAYLAAISRYAAVSPTASWITGGGWAMADFPGGTPHAADLDAVVPDRPVLLHNRDCHGAWVNTAALRLAGLDRDTPDPADGRIERDTDGNPTGTLHEGAVTLVSRLIPPATHTDKVEALLVAQRHLHSLGITGWQDAILGDFGGLADGSDAYLDAARQGLLTARVTGALWWERERGLEQIPDLIARRDHLRAGRFRATSVKIMQDGVTENFTAALGDPYLGRCGHGDHRGLSFVDPDLLAEAVTRLDAAGFQVHFHAIGDRAVRECLDAVAAARAVNGPSRNRHHIAHVQLIEPSQVGRFAELDVHPTMQALWAAYEPQMTELTLPILGEERVAWQYPFGALHRHGARLAAGSDWPVTGANPLWGVHVAVNRVLPVASPDHDPRVFLPEQRLDLVTALTAYTGGSAYVGHSDETGTVRPGRLADLVLLDRDPFAGDPLTIAEASVERTYVGGELVYGAC